MSICTVLLGFDSIVISINYYLKTRTINVVTLRFDLEKPNVHLNISFFYVQSKTVDML